MDTQVRKRKISIVISPRIIDEMSEYINERGRSQFIERALENELKRLKRELLIEAYKEAALEAEKENSFLEGVSSDGISQAW